MDQLLQPSNVVKPAQAVVDTVTTPSRNQWPEVLKVDSQVKEIFSKLATLQSHVDDAEKRCNKEKEAVKWLEKFKNLADMVEDWWDQFRIISLRPKNLHDLSLDEEADQNCRRTATLLEKVRSLILTVCFRLKQDLASSGITLKTKLLNDELSRILEDANKSNYFTSRSLQSVPVRTLGSLTTSLKHLSSVLHQALFDPHIVEENGVAVISIVGHGGAGKTTLAEQLYNDSEVKQFFDLRKWAFMSEASGEEGIANALLSWSPAKNRYSAMSSESLFQIIKDSFSGKKFLLVMDDFGIGDRTIWEPFRDCLKDGAPGSRILVVCRNKNVAEDVLNSDRIVEATLMSTDDSWQVLKEIWLARRSGNQMSKEMEIIGREITSKCKGDPLNLKIVGCLLQYKDTVEEWERVLHSELWQESEPNYGPIPISYDELPPQLKRCFSYLSVFPIDTVINVERLIWMWTAEGFLGPPNQKGDEKMEEKGLEYFNILAARYFFHDHDFVKGSLHKNKVISCRMHNRVHKYAEFVPKGSNQKLRRSFVMFPQYSHEFPNDLFRWWKLKALDLSSCHLEDLSPEVGDLILLQYLNLSGNPLKILPEAMCDLSFLELLDLHLCYLLSSLPPRIGDLQQLRHLRINHTTDELQQLPQGLERLTSIRTLDVFRVGGRYNDLAKLEKLDDLEEISIAIHGVKELGDPKLERKTEMRNLEISFVGEGRDVVIVRTINKFQPPPSLEKLKLEGYPGFQLPKWLEAESFIVNLKRLTIRSALNLLSLPNLWKLSSLEFLWLYNIPNLKRLGREFFGLPKLSRVIKENDEGMVAFPRLKTLRIEFMEEWRIWEDLNESDEGHISKITLMPQMEELIIESCPKLETLPHRILRMIPCLKFSKVNDQDSLFQLKGRLEYEHDGLKATVPIICH